MSARQVVLTKGQNPKIKGRGPEIKGLLPFFYASSSKGDVDSNIAFGAGLEQRSKQRPAKEEARNELRSTRSTFLGRRAEIKALLPFFYVPSSKGDVDT